MASVVVVTRVVVVLRLFLGRFWLSTSKINFAPIHLSNLKVTNEVLSNTLVKEGYKTKSTTRIGYRIPHDLTIFNSAEIALEKVGEFLLFQFVV